MFISMRHGFAPPRNLRYRDPEGHPVNTSNTSASTAEQKPPWGDEENFDAARAWNLIQNLRTEKDGLKQQLGEKDTEISSLTEQLAEKTTSLDSATARVTELEASVSEKDGTISTKDAVITKQQLLSEAGLPLDYTDQVVGDDAESWKSSVGKLKKLTEAAGAQRVPDPVQVAAGSGQTAPDSKTEMAKTIFGV